MAGDWLLTCGHRVAMRERERPNAIPSRPRMCERCGRLRQVEAPAQPAAGELVCAECGAVSVDGTRFRAEHGGGDELEPDVTVAIFCEACWEREFR